MTLYVFISLRGLGIHKRGVSLALVGETDTIDGLHAENWYLSNSVGRLLRNARKNYLTNISFFFSRRNFIESNRLFSSCLGPWWWSWVFSSFRLAVSEVSTSFGSSNRPHRQMGERVSRFDSVLFSWLRSIACLVYGYVIEHELFYLVEK